MSWIVEFLDEAKKDLKSLDHSVQLQVNKGIHKGSAVQIPAQVLGAALP